MYPRYPSFPIVCVLVIPFLLLTAGCTKNNNNLPSGGTMSATAGGAVFNAAQVGGVYSKSLGFMAVQGQTIRSSDSTGLQVQFDYVPPVGVTFSSDSTATILTYITARKRYDAFIGQGRVIVNLSVADTVNHKLTGTFSGTLYNDANGNDSVVVTNGRFSSTYSVQP